MMTKDDYQHFVCIVAGDNPEELLKPYDKTIKKDPYIKYKYKDADLIKSKYIEFYEGLLKIEDETVDNLLKRFKRETAKSGVLLDLRKHEAYQCLP